MVAKSIRLLLVGSNGAVREGLELLLSIESDIEVVGQAADGRSAIRLGRKVRPEIVLVDLESLGSRGIDEAALIQRQLVVDVAVLTLRDDEAIRDRASQAGLHFLTKQGDTRALLDVVRNQSAAADDLAPRKRREAQ